MSGPKRTQIDRPRKASYRIDAEAVALFARLEAVPVRHRMGYAYREHEKRLAKMLGLWPENFLDGEQLNDPTLFLRPPQYEFRRAGWERVTATRKQLLELAGLQADGTVEVPPCETDHHYDDSRDFDDLKPPARAAGKVKADA